MASLEEFGSFWHRKARLALELLMEAQDGGGIEKLAKTGADLNGRVRRQGMGDKSGGLFANGADREIDTCESTLHDGMKEIATNL